MKGLLVCVLLTAAIALSAQTTIKRRGLPVKPVNPAPATKPAKPKPAAPKPAPATKPAKPKPAAPKPAPAEKPAKPKAASPCAPKAANPSVQGSALRGWMVILDPGHGGRDGGSTGIFNGQMVVEDEYVYDVALRVDRLIKARGGLSFLTLHDKKTGIRSWRAQEVFPDERHETFAGQSSIARSGTRGLNQRLAYGNAMSRKYPKYKQAWISIHFDVVGTKKDVEGVRIIKSAGSNGLAQALGCSFGKSSRLRDINPVVVNGDPRFGIRNLWILRGGNKIQEKVLVELGNFNNTTDVWRVRNPVTREAYALAIVEALEGMK